MFAYEHIILIKALATLPPRLGMAEYGLGIGFKGKAFIKIDEFKYIKF